MLSGDMLGTTWGDEEGTVPPEPQCAKLCELGRDTPFANEDRTQAAFPPCFLVLAFRRAEVLLFRGIPYPRGTLWLG